MSQSARRRVIPIMICLLVLGGGAFLGLRGKNDGTRAVVLGNVVRPGAAAGYNILLVTLDTTRADHLGMYGYAKARTPALDGLLAHGVRFDDAVSCAPTTLPAHSTIMTGQYPLRVGVHANGVHSLPDSAVTLAEMLKDQGYDTAAFVAAFVLDERFGLNQGFDTYSFALNRDLPHNELSLNGQRQANEVTSDALRWLNERPGGDGRPFFVWVHYYDAHVPYVSPLNGTAGLENPYDAEIAFIDLHFKRLLEWLDGRKIRERTLIVVASDHGESLGEHKFSGHGLLMYEPEMHIAMLLSCPTLFASPMRVDDRVVGSVDLVPTILELLGRPVPTGLDGRSLLAEANDPNRAIYIETCHPKYYIGCSALYGLRRHQDKFILAPRSEYYNLRKDPGELRNLFGADLPAIAELKSALEQMMKSVDTNGAKDANQLTDEVKAAMNKLGYVQLGAAPDTHCDPKDQIELEHKMTEVNTLMEQDRKEEAFPIALELLEERGCWATPTHVVASVYLVRKEYDKAADVLRKFNANCSDPAMYCLLADIYRNQNRIVEAKGALEEAAKLAPRMGMVHACKGDIAMDEGRFDDAVREYEQALEVDAVRVGADVRDKLARAKARLAGNP